MYFGSEVHDPCRLTLRLLLNCLSFRSVVLLLKSPNSTSWMRLTLPLQILLLWLLCDPWSRHPFCLFQLNLFQGAPPLETPDLNHQLFPWIEFGLELLAASLLGLLLFVHESDFILICGSMGGLGMGAGIADCSAGSILFRGESCDTDVA